MSPRPSPPVLVASAALVAVALAAGASGCRQIAGIKDRDPPPACGDLSTTSGECAVCSEQSCCSQGLACSNDEVCSRTYACRDACGPDNPDCERSCATESNPATVALDACRASACAQACGADCGAVGRHFAPKLAARTADCEPCMRQSCCQPAADCGASGQCLSVASCSEECLPYDLFCTQRCGRADGAASFEALKDCVQKSCADECKVGSFWDCVGSVKPPAPARSSVAKISFKFTPILSTKPTSGAEVAHCTRLDPVCADPMFTTKTDEAGNAEIPHQLVGEAPLETYLSIKHESFLPVLVLLSPAISDDLKLPLVPAVESTTLQGFARGPDGKQFPVNPDLGHVIAFALDCGNAFAGGVSFELTPATEPTEPIHRIYLQEGPLPAPAATKTDGAAFGLVGFLNVPPGPATLTYRLASAPSTDPPLGEQVVDVIAGTLSQALAPPKH